MFKLIESDSQSFQWKQLLLLSLLIVVGYLTRTVGVGALIAVLVFMGLHKRYKELGLLLISCAGMLFVLMLLKNAIWQNGWFDGGQAGTLLFSCLVPVPLTAAVTLLIFIF